MQRMKTLERVVIAICLVVLVTGLATPRHADEKEGPAASLDAPAPEAR